MSILWFLCLAPALPISAFTYAAANPKCIQFSRDFHIPFIFVEYNHGMKLGLQGNCRQSGHDRKKKILGCTTDISITKRIIFAEISAKKYNYIGG